MEKPDNPPQPVQPVHNPWQPAGQVKQVVVFESQSEIACTSSSDAKPVETKSIPTPSFWKTLSALIQFVYSAAVIIGCIYFLYRLAQLFDFIPS